MEYREFGKVKPYLSMQLIKLSESVFIIDRVEVVNG